jgi:hypothetical protein
VETKICGEHVTDKKRIAVEAIRRERAELILPAVHDPARSHFECNEAERCDLITLSAAVR